LDIFIYAGVILLGLTIGSFLNVCIYRLPEGKSIVRPRSFCPKCGERIRALDNIPVLSYLLLRGRCRGCGERISLQYPLVEIVSALVLVILYREFGLSVRFIGYSFFTLALLVVFFTDLNKRIIPDRVSYPSIVVGLIFSAVTREIVSGLLGMALGFVILLFAAWLGKLIFRKEAMGGGDIKLAAMVGAFLGWKLLLVSLFLAFVFGAVLGSVLMVLRGRKEGSEIAFGPFIVAGSIVALFWGAELVAVYMRVLWR